MPDDLTRSGWASVSLGASGPQPTLTNDADPDYRPPRVAGFGVRRELELMPTDPETVPALAVAVPMDPLGPLVWEGDHG